MVEKLIRSNGAAESGALPDYCKYLVVDPNAINLIDQGKRIGDSRLSFYSAFTINAVSEFYKTGRVGSIILFSDASFDDKTKSTGELMENVLLRNGVPKEKIILFPDADLNNTPAQVKRLEEFLRDQTIKPNDVTYIAWDYHLGRIRNHLAGYSLQGVRTISAVRTWKNLHPQFDAEKMNAVLPIAEMEAMEWPRRMLSGVDKKGRVPMYLKSRTGGPHAQDNVRDAGGRLRFMNIPGLKRWQQVQAIKEDRGRLTGKVE